MNNKSAPSMKVIERAERGKRHSLEGLPRLEVHASHVDDCICDCCDGSDEAPGVCARTCAAELDAIAGRVAERDAPEHNVSGPRSSAESALLGERLVRITSHPLGSVS